MKVKLFFILLVVVNFSYLHSEEPRPAVTVLIPMRDGMLLPTDLYRPPDQRGQKHPCVLIRSPAGRKSPFALHYISLTQAGYVVAIQDTRSALDPEGKTFPYKSDGWGILQDGYDTVEWLAKSPYTNGMVGTVGVSALGITQHMMAPSSPPSLKCQYIGVAPGSLYHHALFPGGQILKTLVEGWLGLYARDCGVFAFVSNQPIYNDFWEDYDTYRVAYRIEVPAVHYGGWYDIFLQGTIDAFVARQERGGPGAKGKQKLLIGPWTHFWPLKTSFGDFEVPKEGMAPPVDLSERRWLDYHLKGIENEIDKISPVTYYVMGPFDENYSSGHVWRQADTWPVPSEETLFYLSTDKGLVENRVPQKDGVFTYHHDPRDPVPTIGGRNLFLESGPKDQRPIEQRDDVLVFTSKPLPEDIEVTGQIRAKLNFSSNKEDTDVVVRLTDVYPDGRSIIICDGIRRVGIERLSTREIEVDLWSTSYVFAKGHCIRVSIASSNYPKYECNRNVGFIGCHSGNFSIAENRIHVGKRHPSHIILPITHRNQKHILAPN